jgi:hypothetical protein
MDLQTNRMFTVDLNPLESTGVVNFKVKPELEKVPTLDIGLLLCFPIVPMASEKYWLMLQ